MVLLEKHWTVQEWLNMVSSWRKAKWQHNRSALLCTHTQAPNSLTYPWPQGEMRYVPTHRHPTASHTHGHRGRWSMYPHTGTQQPHIPMATGGDEVCTHPQAPNSLTYPWPQGEMKYVPTHRHPTASHTHGHRGRWGMYPPTGTQQLHIPMATGGDEVCTHTQAPNSLTYPWPQGEMRYVPTHRHPTASHTHGHRGRWSMYPHTGTQQPHIPMATGGDEVCTHTQAPNSLTYPWPQGEMKYVPTHRHPTASHTHGHRGRWSMYPHTGTQQLHIPMATGGDEVCTHTQAPNSFTYPWPQGEMKYVPTHRHPTASHTHGHRGRWSMYPHTGTQQLHIPMAQGEMKYVPTHRHPTASHTHGHRGRWSMYPHTGTQQLHIPRGRWSMYPHTGTQQLHILMAQGEMEYVPTHRHPTVSHTCGTGGDEVCTHTQAPNSYTYPGGDEVCTHTQAPNSFTYPWHRGRWSMYPHTGTQQLHIPRGRWSMYPPTGTQQLHIPRGRWSMYPPTGTQQLHIPVAIGGDEVETAVDPVVNDVAAVQATLITVILLELLVYVVHNGCVAVTDTNTGSQISLVYFIQITHSLTQSTIRMSDVINPCRQHAHTGNWK